MAISYDPLTEQFILAKQGSITRADISLEPTLENALAALEFLRLLVKKTPQVDGPRPDPLGYRKSATEAEIEAYLANGGGVKVSTYDPVKKRTPGRLKPEMLEVASAEDLLSELGL